MANYGVSEEKGPGLAGLLKSYFNQRKYGGNRVSEELPPTDYGTGVSEAGPEAYANRYQFAGQEGLEGPNLQGYEARKQIISPEESILMRNNPGREPQGPSHIPFVPIDALRKGIHGIPFGQAAMGSTPIGPLQRLYQMFQQGIPQATTSPDEVRGIGGGQAQPQPSHIPFVPTEGLTDPNYLNRQKYGA